MGEGRGWQKATSCGLSMFIAREREREREREKETGVHGRLFLGGPCNEVHGMLLVIIILRKGAMWSCVFVGVFVCIQLLCERCKCFLRLAACT